MAIDLAGRYFSPYKNDEHVVILLFDEERGELSITIGSDRLTIPGFVRGNQVYQAVLTTEGQEKVIKRLVANMVLADV